MPSWCWTPSSPWWTRGGHSSWACQAWGGARCGGDGEAEMGQPWCQPGACSTWLPPLDGACACLPGLPLMAPVHCPAVTLPSWCRLWRASSRTLRGGTSCCPLRRTMRSWWTTRACLCLGPSHSEEGGLPSDGVLAPSSSNTKMYPGGFPMNAANYMQLHSPRGPALPSLLHDLHPPLTQVLLDAVHAARQAEPHRRRWVHDADASGLGQMCDWHQQGGGHEQVPDAERGAEGADKGVRWIRAPGQDPRGQVAG